MALKMHVDAKINLFSLTPPYSLQLRVETTQI